MQKEAYFHQLMCITFREETEWIETVSAGYNHIVGYDVDKLNLAIISADKKPKRNIKYFGTGNAAKKIIKTLKKNYDFYSVASL